MKALFGTPLVLTIVCASLLLAACRINVDRDEQGAKANVDIRTPIGDLSVHTGIEPDTGLPVHPGARPAHNRSNEPESADVRIGTSFFGLKVAAGKYEDDAAAEEIVAFYRSELKAFGEVTECRGEIDFRGRNSDQPVCEENPRARAVQLVVGREHQHRMVIVEPRGRGSEFSIVSVNVGGLN